MPRLRKWAASATRFVLLALKREAERLEERKSILVVFSGGDERDVHTTGAVNLVVLDLREDQLLGDAERVVAAAVEAGAEMPRKSRTRGSAVDRRRSRNSHMRSPRRVTLQPIAWPSRTWKPAMDFLARVTQAADR